MWVYEGERKNLFDESDEEDKEEQNTEDQIKKKDADYDLYDPAKLEEN